jgi:hypothetical protein
MAWKRAPRAQRPVRHPDAWRVPAASSIVRLALATQAIAAILVGGSAGGAAAQASAPGRALLPAAETGRSTVVGRIADVTHLDRSGYSATLTPERVIGGIPPSNGALRIAWEELAGARPVRFDAGQRVLVVLEPLPHGSLWRQRFPDESAALAVAAEGDAFLVEPEPRDLDALAVYLRLGPHASPAARASGLARLVGDGGPRVADAALARLAAARELQAAIDPAAAALLLRVAEDSQAPLSLRRDIVAFAGHARLVAAVPQLEALARPGGALEPAALTALGEIRGGLSAEQAESLLDNPAPALREVGARFATGALAERRLPGLARRDPAAGVRAAAATALVRTRTKWGLDAAIPVLADPDPQVRSATAAALGGLGDPAVPTLESVARTQPAEARGAITALSLSGPAGIAAVRRLATDLPDPQLRAFARLALGQGPRAH